MLKDYHASRFSPGPLLLSFLFVLHFLFTAVTALKCLSKTSSVSVRWRLLRIQRLTTFYFSFSVLVPTHGAPNSPLNALVFLPLTTYWPVQPTHILRSPFRRRERNTAATRSKVKRSRNQGKKHVFHKRMNGGSKP